MLAPGFRSLCLATALSCSVVAEARGPDARVGEHGGLPEPTSLVLDVQAPVEVDVTPVADAPSHVPAPAPAGLGKVVLFLMAVVGIALLVLLIVGAIAIYDLVTDNE